MRLLALLALALLILAAACEEPVEAPADDADSSANPTNTSEPQGPAPTPEPAGFRFGDGTKLIGEEVLAGGTYRALNPSGRCYWERLSGLSGSLDDVLANELASGPVLVTIGASDLAFKSQNCGEFTRELVQVPASKDGPIEAGTWFVGLDIAPGTWRAGGGSDSCYWARLAGFSGTLDDILANDLGDASAIVEIAASDKGFLTNTGCGSWTRIP